MECVIQNSDHIHIQSTGDSFLSVADLVKQGYPGAFKIKYASTDAHWNSAAELD
jgi:hypothetical protein